LNKNMFIAWWKMVMPTAIFCTDDARSPS
jgi:hypothetical protein